MSLGSVNRILKTDIPQRHFVDNTATTMSRVGGVPCQTLDVTVPFPARTLRMWNTAMFLFHTAFATLTLSYGKLDLSVPVFKTDLTFVQRANASEGPAFELLPAYSPAGGLLLTWVTAIFFMLSALAHGGNAFLWRSFYEYELARCRVTTRWIEYFFSASVMILVIAYNAGIREYTLLFAIAMLIASTMPFGYITELLAEPASNDAWIRPVSHRVVAHAIGYIPQLSAWMIVLFNFYDETYTGEQKPPDFVYLIIWLQLVLFFSFGGVQIVQVFRPPRDFYKGEIAYQWLSLISKGLLGSLLLANVLVLSSFEEIFQ